MPSHNNDALNNSALSGGGGVSGNTPRGQNYRKAFKPNLPSSSQNGPAGGGGFHENPIHNRQSIKTNPQSSYEPERRSPNIAPRNISHSQN
jgi:hypothetical protein